MKATKVKPIVGPKNLGTGRGGSQGRGTPKAPVRNHQQFEAQRRVVKGTATTLPNPAKDRENARDLGGPKRNQTVVGQMPIGQGHGGRLLNPPMYARTKPKSVVP